MKLRLRFKGGPGDPGSGHHGHRGIPGHHGGSLPGKGGGGAVGKPSVKKKPVVTIKPKEPTVEGMSPGFLHITEADSDIVREHIEDLNKFPPKLHAEVEKWIDGVYIGDKPITQLDANEHLIGITPRGWPADMTWDTVAGGVTPSGVMLGKGDHGCASLAGHEYGHAIGRVTQLENSAAMITHHKRLYSKLDPYLKGTGAGSHSGRQETFAEAIAEMITFGDDEAVQSYDAAYIKWLRKEVFDKWK